MAGEFGTLFTYAGDITDAGYETNRGFYDLISPCKNSVECHRKMLELFINALKVNSILYRTDKFTKVDGISSTEDLKALLSYVPEELQDPSAQVLYEQWNLRQDAATIKKIGNNSWFVETYANATSSDPVPVPDDVENAVNQVRSVEYALLYNELREEYTSKGWAGTVPEAIKNPTPQHGTLNPAFVKKHLDAMKEWLTKNNPQIVALTTLKNNTTAPGILEQVFGPTPVANVDAAEFCRVLLDRIQASNAQKVAGPKGAVRLFLECVEAALVPGSIWCTNVELKELTEQFRAKKVGSYSGKYLPIAFDLIRKLFRTGLTLPATSPAAAQVKASMLTMFKNLNTRIDADNTYLFNELKATCGSLVDIVCPDLDVLAAWAIEIDEAIPETIHYSYIDGLLEVVTEKLSSLQLATVPGGLPVRLFPFSLYDNMSVKTDVVHFFTGDAKTSDVIFVTADADETNPVSGVTTPYYRPVLGCFIREYNQDKKKYHQTFLKFFNVQEMKDGTFYFTDPKHPTLVQQDGFADPPVTLFFDLEAITINGRDTAPHAIGTVVLSGEKYANQIGNGPGVSKQKFIAAIKVLSKWKDLNGKRNYDVIYETVLDKSIAFKSHLIWYVSSGELNRTDNVSDDLCLWQWLASDFYQKNYPKLPAILGLTKASKMPESTSLVFLDVQTKIKSGSGCFAFITIGPDKYVLTNTPRSALTPQKSGAPRGRIRGTANPVEAEAILNLFNFNYYRKIDPANDKVIKYLPATHKPNVAADGLSLDQKGPDDEAAIGINLPVSFRPLENVRFFHDYTAPGKDAGVYLKNKGNPLYRAKGKRLAAGAVMYALRNKTHPELPANPDKSLSADQLSAWELEKSEGVLAKWQSLKQTSRGTLPTNQEWCHLLGHGDGGDERLGNFVSGSFHCNTEQLAMESKGRRGVTQTSPRGTFELRSTAYLFNDDQEFISGNYLENDHAYKRMVDLYKKLHKKPEGNFLTNGAGKVLPLASLIRYKMYHRAPYRLNGDGATPGTISIKKFDHVFEGQSEFMDRHQFSILKHAAWFALAGTAAFDKWYNEQTQASVDGEAAMDIEKNV